MSISRYQGAGRGLLGGMKRWIVALVAALGLGMTAAPAQADEPPLPRLASHVMCLHADFPVTGSGWKLQAAVAVWNERQDIIRMTFASEPGCADVGVHLYSDVTDSRCAYTNWDREWSQAVVTSSGLEAVGADIYLNAPCATAGARYTRRVIAHELGHAMGLPHVDSSRSVMCTCMTYPLTRESLVAPVDVRDLGLLYGLVRQYG